jgi:16S rRNA processing protein RimM
VSPGEKRASPTAIVVGTILGAHGVRGEVRVAPDTDNPDRFRPGSIVALEGVGERRIESVRGAGGSFIVRLEGIADRSAAAALRGRVLTVPIADARAESEGHLWADLIGLRVEREDGRHLGTIADVLRTGGGADVLVVRAPEGKELLLPAIGDVVLGVDLGRGRVVVRPQEEL